MPEGLGYSFSPNRQRPFDDPRGRGVSGASPQDAVKVLSVRNPERVPTQGALAPGLLLNSRGGGGAPPGLLQVLQALVSLSQGQTPAQASPASAPGGIPPPRVRPGDQPVPMPGFGFTPGDNGFFQANRPPGGSTPIPNVPLGTPDYGDPGSRSQYVPGMPGTFPGGSRPLGF